ncbi:MAG TPA: VOC family protein [Bacillus sp. (in: firmicutes)]|uniref:VOC family protein n=1 Tax=Bacillus litorisediminis TaxID=2922713 RepID=UPI001FAEB3C0|nr:VOC family protein [Bacillus litorisediminis]HWO75334.1 VOC family protein [Bacillus sp. (in: firmicutes)]
MNFHQAPTIYVGQVHLKAQNLDRTIAFYTQIIGFKVLEQTANTAVFTADGKTPLLTVEQPEHVKPLNHRDTGLYHFALLLPSRPLLAKALIHLANSQYPLQGASDHYVSEAIYLADPDGNGIEIYADRPADTWKWNNGEVDMATVALNVQDLLAEDDGTPWQGLPAGTVLGHIHLQVSELEKIEEYYVKGLGLDVVTRYGRQALFISDNGYHHHIGLNTWNSLGGSAPAENSVGLSWYTLVLPSEEVKNQMINQLKAINASIYEEEGKLFTNDPSGNKIWLVVNS